MKTKILIIGILLLGCIFISPVTAGTDPLCMLSAGVTETCADGSVFYQGGLAAGTGGFDPFLTLQASNPTPTVEMGFNSPYYEQTNTAEFDEVLGGSGDSQRTHGLLLSDVPIVDYNGELYLKFDLDANEAKNGDLRFMGIDIMRMYIGGNNGGLGYYNYDLSDENFDTPGPLPLVWDMDSACDQDADGDVYLNMDYSLESGSGVSDGSLLLPTSLFTSYLADCYYGSTTCNNYVYWFHKYGTPPEDSVCPGATLQEFGFYDLGTEAGFEEWGVELVIPATKTGVKFNDLNGNHQRDAGEPGLAGFKIYADMDGSGTYDVGEPFGISGADGSYTINGIVSGTRTVREDMTGHDGWICTFPVGCSYIETFEEGMTYPDNDFGNWYPAPTVSKTATPTFTRDWTWTIQKDYDATYNMNAGDSVNHAYEVVVSPTYEDSAFKVAGTITITNPSSTPMVLTSVTDMAGSVAGVVDCPSLTVPASGSLVCTYATAEQSASFTGPNVATVVYNGASYTGSAAFAFGDPTTENDPVITVNDDNLADEDWSADRTGGEWTYGKDFACSSDPDDYTDGFYSYTHVNTATIVETGDDDDATVVVNCYAPVVSKTAAGAYDERHDWDVEKTVVPISQSAFAGDTVGYEWEVVVTEDVFEENFAVTGVITVVNPNPAAAMVVGISDELDDGTPGVIVPSGSCNYAAGILTIPADSTATCEYTAIPTDTTAQSNTATVTYGSLSWDDTQAFGWTPHVIRGSVELDDDQNPAFPLTISEGGTWTYEERYTCSSDLALYESDYTYTFGEFNLATIKDGTTLLDEDYAETAVDCYIPTISKTATGTYGESHTWEVVKTVDPTSQDAFAGDTVDYEWTVMVTETVTEGTFVASGTITVGNPNPEDALTVALSDVVDSTPATITACTGDADLTDGLTVAAGGSSVCTYTADLAALDDVEDAPDLNTATITLNSIDFSATDPIEWAPTVTGASVTLDDDQNPAFPITISDGGTWTYSGEYTCSVDDAAYGDDNTYTYGEDNTAVIKDGDTILDEDDASTTVDCWVIDVAKTADTTSERSCDWTLDKSVDHELWPLYTGDTASPEFTLTPGVECTDGAFDVAGTITIHNPAPMAATLIGVTDVISHFGSVTPDCGVTFPYDLAAGADLICSYETTLPDADTEVNEATVAMSGKSYSTEAVVEFDDPTTTVHGCVILDDTNWGDGEEIKLCYDDVLTPISYAVDFTCDDDVGQHDNTANLVDADTFVELASDDASVTVTCNVAAGAEKDATTSFTRTYTWDIDKVGDQTALELSPGQTFNVNYDVTVTTTPVDSDWAVAGTITITSSLTDRDLTITSVTDMVDGIAAVVDCGTAFPITIAAGGTLECDYSADLLGTTQLVNTATIVGEYATFDYSWNGAEIVGVPDGGTEPVGFNPTADVIFSSDPTLIVDECIDVTDDQYGDLGTVCVGDLPVTFSYTIPITASDICSDIPGTFTNCASFVTNDTGATGEDCWTVTITVPCLGCTLTPGYWKTHSEYGPAAHPDDTWYLLPGGLGPDTLFFDAEVDSVPQTWYMVFWTSPKGGDAFYILAHQYEAAVLNILNEASAPANVVTAISDAEALLDAYDGNPTTIAVLKGKNASPIRSEFLRLAGILGDYNEGIIGPGHCDEDETSDNGFTSTSTKLDIWTTGSTGSSGDDGTCGTGDFICVT